KTRQIFVEGHINPSILLRNCSYYLIVFINVLVELDGLFLSEVRVLFRVKILIPDPKSSIIIEITAVALSGLIRINAARYRRDSHVGNGLSNNALGTNLGYLFCQFSILLFKMFGTVNRILSVGWKVSEIFLFREHEFEIRYSAYNIVMTSCKYEVFNTAVILQITNIVQLRGLGKLFVERRVQDQACCYIHGMFRQHVKDGVAIRLAADKPTTFIFVNHPGVINSKAPNGLVMVGGLFFRMIEGFKLAFPVAFDPAESRIQMSHSRQMLVPCNSILIAIR